MAATPSISRRAIKSRNHYFYSNPCTASLSLGIGYNLSLLICVLLKLKEDCKREKRLLERRLTSVFCIHNANLHSVLMDKENHIDYKLLHYLWSSMEDPIKSILLTWKLAQVKVMDLVLQTVEQLLEAR